MNNAHVNVWDWRAVARIIAASKATTLKEKAAVILRLFPRFPTQQIAGTDEWMLTVQQQAGKEANRKDLRGHSLAPEVETQGEPGHAEQESLEALGEKVAREHPGWPRREIAGTQEWKDYVRSQASSGFGDLGS
jgi:hypothetical protein